MNEVLVIGHRNPDADSICSAIGYAELKLRQGQGNVVACRCGDTNERIDFILSHFNVPSPRFVPDIYPKVSDIMRDKVETADAHDSALDVLSIMEDRAYRMMPVLDGDHKVLGLVSLFKLSDYFFPTRQRLGDTRRVLASLRAIAKSLTGHGLHLVNPDREEDLILMVAAMQLESFSMRMKSFPSGKIILVVGDRREIQEVAIEAGIRLLVITGGLEVEDDILQMAKAAGVSVMQSTYDSATTAWLVRSSVAIAHMVDLDFVSFTADHDLEDARAQAVGAPQNAFPVITKDKTMAGIFSKSDFLRPVEKQIILVDHNELSQAVRGAEKATILEIIDHHKLNPMSTAQPILFINEPVGSTSTIVADQFFRYQVELSPAIAGVLMSGLLSDTLNLKSPTATPKDKYILDQLSEIVGIAPGKLAERLFASGSVLSIKSPAEAITADCKEYVEKDYRFSVAQVEELGFSHFVEKKAGLLLELETYVRRQGYLFSALLVTDINTNTSYLLVRGAERFLATIDYQPAEPFVYELAGVVSRKKQLLPHLLRCLSSMKSN